MAKRQSLSSFSPQPHQADGGKVVATMESEPVERRKSPKYPHVSVYLRNEEIRTLKLLSLEMDMKVSDICAVAVREWLTRNGHARTGDLTAEA